ncbi:hypothetical protein Q6346_14675 [Isoptericola sp. b490]|uniref:hypothetical protein n=1 Tax=Actinotalea lenta TaxID=3064654 RepID=UPI002712F5F5|nr:hypothetical protein [Isoptericola sp. b490]MDO8122553.1 hypothetical protein [Isoptericola sp. b490]
MAIALAALRAAASPDAFSTVLGFALGVVLVALLIVGLASVRARATERARAASPGAWVHACADPRASRGRRVLRVDDVGVWVLDAHVDVLDRWPYQDIEGVRASQVQLPEAARTMPGIEITVAGASLGFLLPGKTWLTTPAEPIQQAIALIEAGIEHARGNRCDGHSEARRD